MSEKKKTEVIKEVKEEVRQLTEEELEAIYPITPSSTMAE